MIQLQSAPFILIVCILLLVLGGLSTLVWGRRLPRNGDWLVAILLALVIGGLIFAGNGLIDEGVSSKVWLRGWIWPADAQGAVTAGILLDPIGLIMAGFVVVVSAVLLGMQTALSDQPRKERFYSAVALGAAGVSLCWVSLTPWFSFIGLSLVILSGFLSLGSRWDSNEESGVAIRFGFHRSFGLMLSILGACGLAGARTSLAWNLGPGGEVVPWLAVGQTLTLSEWVGAALLIGGLCVQLNPFPLLGWVVSPSKTAPWVRAAMTQVFPALGVFAILHRLQEHLGSSVVFVVFGWALLGSTVLAVISGLFQTRWERALGAWLSAGATLTGAMLCLGGDQAGLSVLIAFAAGSIAFSSAQSILVHDMRSGQSPPRQGAGDAGTRNSSSRDGWAKAAAYLGICASTGVFGFVSSGGGLRWILLAWQEPALAAAAISVFALFAVLGWKLAWMTARASSTTQAHWSAIALPFVLVLLAFGIVWTGSLSGGALPANADRVTQSLMDLFFRNTPSLNGEDPAFLPGVGAYWGALLFAIAMGYWASIKIRPPVGEESSFSSRLFRFIVSGYGTDRAADRALRGITWLAGRVQEFVDGRLWGRWIPYGFVMPVRRTAETLSDLDSAIARGSQKIARQWIDVPAKFLQMVQNGDVQWYLLFALGSGFAILIHFLWSAGGTVIQ